MHMSQAPNSISSESSSPKNEDDSACCTTKLVVVEMEIMDEADGSIVVQMD